MRVCVQQRYAVLPCSTDELQSDHYVELVVMEAALRSSSAGRLFSVDSLVPRLDRVKEEEDEERMKESLIERLNT